MDARWPCNFVLNRYCVIASGCRVLNEMCTLLNFMLAKCTFVDGHCDPKSLDEKLGSSE